MTNGNNAAQGKHLESLATATKRYILAQILDVTDAVSSELENASGSGVLDTVPATVNGGMWYELDSGVPRYVKLKHGDHTLSLTPSIVNISPGLTVTPAATTVPADGSITANVSFNGNGNITVTSDTINPTYNASTKKITVPYSYDVASATITVELSAGYGYLADSTTFNVTMAKASPNLSVTPSATTTDGDDITAAVTYSGDGTLSVSSDNANVTPTVSGSTITVPYYAFTDADTTVTITVSVSANGNYNAQTVTFSVLYEKALNLDPQLTIVDYQGPYNNSITKTGDSSYEIINGSDLGFSRMRVSYFGDGEITITAQDPKNATFDWNASTKILQTNYWGYSNFLISLSAAPPYVASTITLHVEWRGIT